MRFLTTLLLILSLALPVFAQTGTIDTDSGASEDAAIAVRIRNIKEELGAYDDVTVLVHEGIVTLRGEVLDAADAERLAELAARVNGVVAVQNDIEEATGVRERIVPAMERIEARLWALVAIAPLLLIALTVFIVVVTLGWAAARLKQPWDRIAPNPFIADVLRVILQIASVIAGIVLALDLLGATALLSTFLGAAGIIGLAISFAVKDTVENFIASVMLSIRQPFRPNDTVEIEGDTGKVVRLTSRATILLSFDGNQIRIPNSTVFKARIVNFTRNPERRFTFDIGLSLTSDIAAARHLAEDTMQALPFTLDDPAPSSWIETLGGSDLTMRCAAWIDQHVTNFAIARSESIRMVKGALEAAGYAAPEPTYRVINMAEPAAPAAPEAPLEVDLHDMSPETEAVLEKIAEEERRGAETSDLLDHKAVEE